jgi:quercetin dioxygenase-like cupin family protein
MPHITLRRALAAAIALPSVLMLANAALAGECPAGKSGVDLTKPVSTPAKDVTDTVLAATDLGGEAIATPDRQLRLRKLVVKPGGVVPWHSHADRPAIIYIVEGEMTEYASTCAVPIVHKSGDVARETKATSHWWKNTGNKTAVLLSADILHDQTDKNM